MPVPDPSASLFATENLPEAVLNVMRLETGGDLDMRTVLMRVMTDLFISRPHLDFEEIRRFETLACGMLDRLDAPTREMLASKLATCWSTPLLVAEKLVAGGGRAAEIMLEKSSVLPRAWLLAAAVSPSTREAAAVARRADLTPEICDFLAARPELEVARELAANITSPLNPIALRMLVARGAGDKALGAALCARISDISLIAPLFLHASPLQRSAVLLDARRAELGNPRSHADPTQIEMATATELETALVNRDAPLGAAIIARVFATSVPAARDILEDATGEAMALVLCALYVPHEAAERIFMSLHEGIAHDFRRVRMLSRMVEEIPQALAMRLSHLMLEREPSVRRAPVHAPAAQVPAAYAQAAHVPAAETPSRPLDNSRPAEKPVRKTGLLFARRRA